MEGEKCRTLQWDWLAGHGNRRLGRESVESYPRILHRILMVEVAVQGSDHAIETGMVFLANDD